MKKDKELAILEQKQNEKSQALQAKRDRELARQ